MRRGILQNSTDKTLKDNVQFIINNSCCCYFSDGNKTDNTQQNEKGSKNCENIVTEAVSTEKNENAASDSTKIKENDEYKGVEEVANDKPRMYLNISHAEILHSYKLHLLLFYCSGKIRNDEETETCRQQ